METIASLEPPRRTLRFDASLASAAQRTEREWLVTNGLGGYACGTLSGLPTRRFHALLVAALPAPIGRATLLQRLGETVQLPDGRRVALDDAEASPLVEFRLEAGLPVWRFAVGGFALERRIAMVHRENTVHVTYAVVEGEGALHLSLRPFLDFRPHEGSVAGPSRPHRVVVDGARYEVHGEPPYPPLRLAVHGGASTFTLREERALLRYDVEESRGYDHEGALSSPGHLRVTLAAAQPCTLIASCEPWEVLDALPPAQASRAERARRERLLAQAHPCAQRGVAAELVLAADQFVIAPATRASEGARASAAGDEVRTVIAGYHWFTDWGRDTMISLEGLTLLTGRHVEAGYILRTFARYVRDGLIPNLFPEGQSEGLYHTADASLWFFHALARYLAVTGDHATLVQVAPALVQIAEAHLSGTRFGIGVDSADGLLRQGAEGYQLTWMDAKVDGWVVTPRRGKAVEINALFYNALRLLSGWMRALNQPAAAARYQQAADRAHASFNARFWNPRTGCLYDVIDGEEGDDDACRPNQLLSVSLAHPILDRARWSEVLEVCRAQLLTPVGLRSLAPSHPSYAPRYFGDLRTRDAAYHQGTVWGWLIGPFVDAWLKVRPHDRATLRGIVAGFTPHLDEACVGSVSEVFDAEAPFAPRGCVAQAWSVAELLRCHVLLAP